VKDYVRSAELYGREMSVPLTHAPAEAQAGEVLVVIAGVEQKAHYLTVHLPHSDDCFVAAFRSRRQRHFWKSHLRAFAYLGGFPRGSSPTTRRLIDSK
jgi:transposase